MGGSDAAAAMGETPYRSRHDIYSKLLGHVEDKDLSDVPDVQRGNDVEPRAIEWIKENHDRNLNSQAVRKAVDDGGGHDDQIFLRHPEHEWIGGHPDGVGHNGKSFNVWEVKAPRSRKVQTIKRHGVPRSYYWQLQHYMMILLARWDNVMGYLAVWDCDAWRPFVYEVKPSFQDQAALLSEYKDLKMCVDMQMPPSEAPYAQVEYEDQIETDEYDPLLQEYVNTRDTYYESKDRKDELKGEILTNLPEAEKLVTPQFVVDIQENWGRYDATRLTVSER